MTKALFRRSGMSPLESILWKIVVRPSARLYLHFLRRMEGIPSGPGAEFAESLSRASRTSCLSKAILSRYSLPSSIEKNSW